MRRIATIDFVTHRRPEETAAALRELVALAREAGVTLSFSAEEAAKHADLSANGVVVRSDVDPPGEGIDLCLALGGDGTVLSALREYAGTGVPVFGINFGVMGFLTTVDRRQLSEGFRRALAGEFEVLPLPAIEATGARGRWLAFNDVSMHRQQGLRVADLQYSVGAQDIGRVRCDGLVVSTPAGSTGYNLANGGPVMAWGVAGYIVSFIAPHSFTARTLVVAPGDAVAIDNRSQEEPVDVTIDGRPVCTLGAGERLKTRFIADQGTLAQIPGTTFYRRLREKFGLLATPL
ncbi:MAG TPA: NAD(+)/NADH kinase [Solirubrobacteraceae bacterium]|nr:NAD(+)/NADH kinase [Solirubrobacteraceae bacterium]